MCVCVRACVYARVCVCCMAATTQPTADPPHLILVIVGPMLVRTFNPITTTPPSTTLRLCVNVMYRSKSMSSRFPIQSACPSLPPSPALPCHHQSHKPSSGRQARRQLPARPVLSNRGRHVEASSKGRSSTQRRRTSNRHKTSSNRHKTSSNQHKTSGNQHKTSSHQQKSNS